MIRFRRPRRYVRGIRIEGPGANDNIVENNRVEGSGLAGIGLHENAVDAGASAVIFFNEGTAGRTGERPGSADHGRDVGEARGRSVGSRV